MSENKYNNSKIYLIKCRLDNNLIYVGSTIQTLKQRWNEHKTRYKIESDKEYNKLLYIKMREIGIENFYIELYKIFNCDCKTHLRQKEGEIIKNIGSLNICIAGRKIKDYNKEYKDKNKNKITEKRKEYYLKNKEEMKQKRKEYYLKNIEENKQKNKDHYLKNKDENKEEKKQKQKEYYLKNKEEKIQKQKQYRTQNKEQIKEQQKQYRIQNKGKIYERNKIYLDNNKAFIKEYRKQYYLKKKLEKEQII